MQVGSLSWEDPLKEGMATYSSILAWRIPWTEEPGPPPGRPPKPPHCNAHGHGLQHMPALETPATVLFL